ncbi:hypothetical protein HFP72_24330 [Nocardiopsis sp. ARC36]
MRRDLRHDTEALQKFTEKLNGLALDIRPTGVKEPTVLLGTLLKEGEPVTVDPLFFVQNSLLHTDSVLRILGAQPEVIAVSR